MPFFVFFKQIKVLWQPCVQQVYQCHFPNSICLLHVCVTFWQFLWYSKPFNYYYIGLVVYGLWCYYCHCFGEPWTMSTHVRWCTYLKMLCVLWLLCWPAVLILLFLLGLSYSLRHNSIEIRPINNPTMTSKCSSDRESHMSLTLNQSWNRLRLVRTHVKSWDRPKVGLLHQLVKLWMGKNCSCGKWKPLLQ